jgi:uncharacterized RDD family membrane protein YckC
MAVTSDSVRAGHRSVIPAPARTYQGARAGVVTRTFANAIDLGVVIGILVGIYAVIAAAAFLLRPREFHWPDSLAWGFPVVGVAVLVPYLTLSWATTGRTYGDSLLGLRVVNYRGERVRIVGAAVRAVACAVFPIGLFWVAISPHNRSLQDVVLRTSVIYDWTPRPSIAG